MSYLIDNMQVEVVLLLACTQCSLLLGPSETFGWSLGGVPKEEVLLAGLESITDNPQNGEEDEW